MTTEIVPQEARPLAQVQLEPLSEVGQLIRFAIDKGQEPKELYAILQEERRTLAEKAFAKAMAAFQAEHPKVVRRSENPQFKITRNGITGPSKFASKEDIMAACGTALTRNGLSVSWGTPTIAEGMVFVPCIVTHAGGYSRPTAYPFPTAADSRNTNPSPAQKWASTLSYAERYSLKAALGLTDVDGDDVDGATGEPGEPITQEQVRRLNDLIIEVGPQWRDPMLKFLSARHNRPITTLDAIPASEFDLCALKLESKRAKE